MHVHHTPHAPLAAQVAQQQREERRRVEAVRLRPALPPVLILLDAGGVDDVIGDA
jgi:hypothetical protein